MFERKDKRAKRKSREIGIIGIISVIGYFILNYTFPITLITPITLIFSRKREIFAEKAYLCELKTTTSKSKNKYYDTRTIF